MEKDGGKREETYARRIRDIAVTTFFSVLDRIAPSEECSLATRS